MLNNNEYVKKNIYIQHLKIILKGILLIDQPINRQLSLVPCIDIFLLSVSIYWLKHSHLVKNSLTCTSSWLSPLLGIGCLWDSSSSHSVLCLCQFLGISAIRFLAFPSYTYKGSLMILPYWEFWIYINTVNLNFTWLQ